MAPQTVGSSATKVAEEQSAGSLAKVDPAQLPVEVTSKVRAPGDLISRDDITDEQAVAAEKIAATFNWSNTASILTFGNSTQLAMTRFLDELLAGIKTGDVGLAGDIAKQMASGIDLMKLDKVKQQILQAPSHGLLGRALEAVGNWTNYIRNFFENQKAIRDLIDKIERQAQNRMATLQADSDKLDKLAERTVTQIHQLAAWILAGEMILVQARKTYLAQREQVISSNSAVDASNLRDFARKIAAFEKRMLEVEIAYVAAGNKALPRIRTVQEADTIEIQNLSEEILFHLPEFKEAVIYIASLSNLKDARDSRRRMDANQRHLEEVLDDSLNEASALAKESQGDPLARVQALEVTIGKIKAGIENGVRIENEAREQRNQAHQILLGLKDAIADSIKAADMAAAQQS